LVYRLGILSRDKRKLVEVIDLALFR